MEEKHENSGLQQDLHPDEIEDEISDLKHN